MIRMAAGLALAVSCGGAALSQQGHATLTMEDDDVAIARAHYSPFLDEAYPDRVFWGDTHLHASYSTDAGMIGNALGPDEAFRFARGEKVRASVGEFAHLVRPLDFLVVADHAENLGLAPMIAESNPQLLALDWGRTVHDLVKGGDPFCAYAAWGAEMQKGEDPLADDDLTRTIWNRIVDSAERRMRWEPFYEVTQIKGDGETHPMLSPNDEFADYYTRDRGNFGTELKTTEMLPREYARTALARGLAIEEEIGANPFKIGMIGSTDSHTSLGTTREDNYFGKASPFEPGTGKARYEEYIILPIYAGEDIAIRHYETLASGLAAAWARENTRQAIWDAFKRKEVYATTGSRITVRVFAGWDCEADEVHRPDFAAEGYARGVPMGRDLFPGPEGVAPAFMIRALRDPDGANLDRIRIVKRRVEGGEPRTKVFDVAWSGDRAPEAKAEGRLPPVGSTVEDSEFTNTIGAGALGGHWVDPEFDPAQRAYYYVRVLEIPTPSWLAHDQAFYGPLDLPDNAVMVQQDRAYTSPIWYGPAN